MKVKIFDVQAMLSGTSRGLSRGSYWRAPFTLLSTLGAFLVRQELAYHIGGPIPPFLIAYPLGMIIALTCGFGWAVVAIFASAILTCCFVFPLTRSIPVWSVGNLVSLAVFCGLSVSMSAILESSRRKQQRLGALAREKDRQAIEEALRGKEKLLQEVCRLSKTGGWDVDLETGNAEWTQEVARIHEVEPSFRPSVETGLRFYQGESRSRIEAALQQAVEDGSPYDLELEIISAKGVPKWVRTTCQPEVENGKVTRLRGTFQEITERKIAQDQLRQSEALFSKVFHSTAIGINIFRLTDNCSVNVNKRYLDMLGCEREEVVGHVPVELSPFPSERSRSEWLENFYRKGSIRNQDARLRCKSGEIREVVASIEMIDTEVEPLGMILILDITERKRAEAALVESEERLRLLIEYAPVALAMLDSDMRYLNASRRWLADYGLSHREVKGVSHYELFPELPERWKTAHRRGLAGDILRVDEDYFERPNGTKQWIRWEVRPWRTSRGDIGGIVIFTEDITERKLAHEQLRKSEERFSRAFHGSPLPMSISRANDGVLLDANHAFSQLVHRPLEEIRGKPAAQLDWLVDPADRLETLRQLWENGRVIARHTQFTDLKGLVRELEVSAEMIEIDEQMCILAISRDVTQEKRLEAQLQQAQKMEAVGNLAGGIAHDFNNLLGIIIGFCDLSLPETVPGSTTANHLEEIRKAADRASTLTRQLLAFGRRQVITPRVLDLNEVMENSVKLLSRMIPEDIRVSFQPATPIGNVRADPHQIDQIAMNLILNARDAIRESGRILVETAAAELDELFVSRHPGSRVGPYVCLTVSDNGCGMDEATRLKAFDPFFTTKPAGRGSGLGLSTVYGIVKQSGGYISVYSEPGKGTTFKLFFPRVDAPAEPLSVPEPKLPVASGPETILLVEDDESLRRLSVQVLRNAGYQVIPAPDADSALKIVNRKDTKIDLLLTDVMMPGKSGFELLAEARKITPDLHCLLMSGYSPDLISAHRPLEGDVLLLEKPFNVVSLLTKVRAALR